MRILLTGIIGLVSIMTLNSMVLVINQSINQLVKPIVAELLLGKVRNEKKKTKTNKKTAMKS